MPFQITPVKAYGAEGFFEGDGSRPVDAAQAVFPIGTPLTFDTSSHTLKEHPLGTTVTNLLGFSLEGLSATGLTNLNLGPNVQLAKATRDNAFAATLTNGSDTPVTPTIAHVGQTYGITKHSTLGNAWYSVDIANTHLLAVVTGFSAEMMIVYFKVIESAVQEI